MQVTRKIKGYSVSLRKPNVIELHIDGWWVASSNCYDNLQKRLFELLLDKIPLTERTTKEVMELYFNIQLLFDIAKQEMWNDKDLQLPSDFLIDNHKSLSKRRDFEDLCESLDDLQHEAMNLAFQDGFDQGELNILRQFVEGQLDRDYILEMCGEQLGLGDMEWILKSIATKFTNLLRS